MIKRTPDFLIKMKQNHEKISMLTVYDATFSAILSETDLDVVLVGDSIANVIYGYDSTNEVSIQQLADAVQAVSKTTKYSLVLADLPNEGLKNPLESVELLIKAGAEAVKIELFSEDDLSTIRNCVDKGFPVMAHLGLTPQYAKELGGFKVQGRDPVSYQKALSLAKASQEAGAFAVLVECTVQKLGKELSELLSIPVIGIGAGAGVDGQVIVFHDLLGFTGGKPKKFVKTYLNGANLVKQAVNSYSQDVKQGQFPLPENSFD